MRVYLGCDHAGLELKQYLLERLAATGWEVVDVGAQRFDPDDDYPAFCLHTAARVVADPGSLGVVVGGSGNGEQIAANKVPGARAALVWTEVIAALAREHNDANVAAIGARMHSPEQAAAIITVFLTTAFSGGDRHLRRIGQIAAYEAGRQLPKIPPTIPPIMN